MEIDKNESNKENKENMDENMIDIFSINNDNMFAKITINTNLLLIGAQEINS